MPMLPFCFITNRLNPEDEAVKRSPTPGLSTTRAAKEVFEETEAIGVVPAKLLFLGLDRTSSDARGLGALIPTRPLSFTTNLPFVRLGASIPKSPSPPKLARFPPFKVDCTRKPESFVSIDKPQVEVFVPIPTLPA